MTEIGTRGGEDPLELDTGDDVLIEAVAVFAAQTGVEDLETRRGDDGADLDRLLRDGHLMVDRPGDAGVDALVALGADAAGQAALRLPDGLLLGEAQPHLPEIALPRFRLRGADS